MQSAEKSSHAENILEIKGMGGNTLSGIVAGMGDIARFGDVKRKSEIRRIKLCGM